MKLRNKETGELGELKDFINDGFIVKVTDERGTAGYKYDSLALLNEEWEDYTPKEPLIKDKKIRKAVRAWAEANGIDKCICKEEIHCITFETERGMFISFEGVNALLPEGNFTITELCGEEE